MIQKRTIPCLKCAGTGVCKKRVCSECSGVGVILSDDPGDLQDGMLIYFNSQAPFADANVEARIEKTPLTGLK